MNEIKSDKINWFIWINNLVDFQDFLCNIYIKLLCDLNLQGYVLNIVGKKIL